MKKVFLFLVLVVSCGFAQDCQANFRYIEHAAGTACVPANPQRVVVLDALDNVLSLGITPVGAANWIGTATGEDAAFPSYLDPASLEAVAWLGNSREPNLEKLLSLNPDIILGRKNRHEAIYDQLSAIAPTVLIDQRGVGGWRGQFVAYAEALSQQEKAAQLLADYDARAADIASRLAALDNPPTVSLVRFDPERIVIYQKQIFAGSVLEDAGVTRPEYQNKDQRTENISLEQVNLIDADILLTTAANPEESMLAELQANPLWSQLQAVQNEQVYSVPFDIWIGGWTISGANLILDEVEKVVLKNASDAEACAEGFHLFEHEYMEGDAVCIPDNPQRIAVLDFNATSLMLSLGIKPVAYNGFWQEMLTMANPEVAEDLEDLLADARDAGERGNESLETLTLAQPDVIFAPNYNPANLAALNAIAPTVMYDTAAPWREAIGMAGEVIGKAEDVTALFEQLDARIELLSTTLAETSPTPTLATIGFYSGQTEPYLLLDGFAYHDLLHDAAVTLVPTDMDSVVAELGSPVAALSTERLDLIDADRLLVIIDTATGSEDFASLRAHPLWKNLGVVKNDEVYSVGSYWYSSNPYDLHKVIDDIFRIVAGVEPADISPNPLLADQSSSADFPISLSHSLGNIEIPAAPERVAALSLADSDIAYAFGYSPLSIYQNPFAESGLWPWLAEKYEAQETTIFPTNSVPVEKILELNPDIILAGGRSDVATFYADLSAIAPTTAWQAGVFNDSWQEQTLFAGRALGKQARAAQLVSETEASIATLSEAFPQIAGKTFSLSFLHSEAALNTIYREQDFAVQFFKNLGFELSPELAELAAKEGAFQGNLSLETLNLIDADVVMLAFSSAEMQAAYDANPLYQQLAAVKEDRVIVLDLSTISQLRSPTVLGIRWVVEQLHPEFARLFAE